MQVPWTAITANPVTSEIFVKLFFSHCDYHVAWRSILDEIKPGIALVAITKGSHVESTYVSGRTREEEQSTKSS
jgi:glutaredoxin